jgi:hypothetical protein
MPILIIVLLLFSLCYKPSDAATDAPDCYSSLLTNNIFQCYSRCPVSDGSPTGQCDFLKCQIGCYTEFDCLSSVTPECLNVIATEIPDCDANCSAAIDVQPKSLLIMTLLFCIALLLR